MISILLSILVLVVIVYVVTLVINMLNLPGPVKQIALLIVGLCALLWLLGVFGVVPVPMLRY